MASPPRTSRPIRAGGERSRPSQQTPSRTPGSWAPPDWVHINSAQNKSDIFRRYLELETVRALRDDLAAAGVVSKRRTAADGSPYGGQRFSRGALYLMLKNRIYRGEIVHKGKAFPGEHAAIVDEDLWRRVQSHLEENRMERREGDRALEPSLLAGIVFDACSEPMTPTHAVKKGTRYCALTPFKPRLRHFDSVRPETRTRTAPRRSTT